MLETWGAALLTILTPLWLWIVLAVGALVVGITVELLTRDRTSPRAAIGRAFVAMLVAPAVFYGIQRGIEAPERATEARDNQRRTELLTDVAARVGNPDAAKELIELRAQALFSPGTSDAERFAHELSTQLPEKKIHHQALQDESAKEAMRLRLDWEPFLRAFLEQFDRRVAALQSHGIDITPPVDANVFTGEVLLVQHGSQQRPIVRDVQVAGRYRLRVQINTGQVEFGKLTSFPSFFLVGTMVGDRNRYFITVDFRPGHVNWDLNAVGPNDRRSGVMLIGKDPQAEEYRQAIHDALNFAFEYAVLTTTR